MNLNTKLSPVKTRYRKLLSSTAIISAAFFGMMMPQQANAFWFPINECGPAVGGVVVCNGDGTPASDVNPYTNGIRYDEMGNLNLTIDGTTIPITVVAPFAQGVYASVLGGTLTINTLGNVSIAVGGPTSKGHTGIYGRISGEDAGIININTDANIAVNASYGRGIYTSAGIGIANINLSGGSITANLSNASGIWVEAQRQDGIQPFLGKIADINVAGNIEVKGANGYGIYLTASDFPGGAPQNPTASINIMQGGRVFAILDEAIGEGAIAEESVSIDTTLTIAGEVARPSSAQTVIGLDTGDDTVILQPTASVTGIIDGGANTDTFKLEGGAGTSGTLDLDNSPVVNFEMFEKNGAGQWEVKGDGTAIVGDFSVNDGHLKVNGDLGNANFSIADGATLSGSGSFGSLTLQGTLAPGNSIGTLNLAGSVTISATSTYEAEVASNGTSDLINVGVTATINGGKVKAILQDPAGNYTDGQKFTILTAAGGVTGTYDSVSDDSALVNFALSYNANNVFLTLSTSANFAAFANTYNQKQVAGALTNFTAASDTEAYNALLALNSTDLTNAMDRIQGEIYASGQAGAAEAGEGFNRLMTGVNGAASGSGSSTYSYSGSIEKDSDAISRRIANANADAKVSVDGTISTSYGAPVAPVDSFTPPSYAFWMGGYGAYARVDGDGNGAEWKSRTGGLGAGVEYDLSALNGMSAIVGLAGGYSRSDINISARGQSADVNSYHVGLYARSAKARFSQGFAANGAVSYAWQKFDSSRTIAFGTLNRTANADYNGNTFAGSAELRYNIALGGGSNLSAGKVLAPFVRYQGTYTHQDGFTETGAGGLNLTGASSNYNAASIIAGISIGGEHMLENGAFQGEITIAYERAVGDVLPTASLSLAGSPTRFNVNGPLEDRDRLRLGANADFNVSENTSFGVDVVSLLSKDRVEYSAKAAFKMRF